MTAEDRIKAIEEFGFTSRQARFLVTVLLHAGVCVPRQYATFAGTAYGHNVTTFFDRLVQRGYATASHCLHNRAALYHIQHQALYRAIGQPHSRYRRPVSARQAIDRVMLLDGIITDPELVWLATEDEKVAFFSLMAPSFQPERLPHLTVGKAPCARVRLFPDSLPIGVEGNGRAVFLYLATSSCDHDLRAFVQRHGDLFRALPGWTLRLLVLRRTGGVMGSFEAVVRDELTPWSPPTVEELRWYCEQRRTASDPRARCQSDERFGRAHRAFSTQRGQRLYHRWLTDGDTVFEGVSSTAITEALARGTARVETQVLLPSYAHLSPLVSLVRSLPKGVEEGATDSTPPQPPPAPPLPISEQLSRDWYRLIAARECSCGERSCSVCRAANGAAFSAPPDSGSVRNGRGTMA
jgi:hypothetical protein